MSDDSLILDLPRVAPPGTTPHKRGDVDKIRAGEFPRQAESNSLD
jgi:hypothetical protein